RQRPGDDALARACAWPRGPYPQAHVSHHCAAGGASARRAGGRAGRGSGRRGGAEAEPCAREEEDHRGLQEEDRLQASRQEEGDSELMGQKVHPGGMRVGVIHDWKSNWYTGKKEFPGYLIEDIKIRDHITNKLSHAGL